MKYYYVLPEQEGKLVAVQGIQADERGGITLIVLKDSFLMDRFVIDVYAFEVLGSETYCLYEISGEGIFGNFSDSGIDNSFSEFYKVLIQPLIQSTYVKQVSTERYESMGLAPGVSMVENREKFNEEYKKKILGYYRELG